MNEQQNFWANEYSEEYIRKNKSFNQDLGKHCWGEMLKKTDGIESILECGCNIGRNLDFLQAILPSAKKSIIEISKPAYQFVTKRHELAEAYNGSIINSNLKGHFDLVFTIGVLIHIHPNDLLDNMKKILNYSEKYILIGEYFNRTPTMIEYQGQQNKLFKRDFGRMIMEHFDVSLKDYGFLWGKLYDDAGFDDITWWLFEKN